MIEVAAIYSVETEPWVSPREKFDGVGSSQPTSSSLGHESGEHTRGSETDRLQREHLVQQPCSSTVLSVSAPCTVKRTISVGMKMSDWIWEGYKQRYRTFDPSQLSKDSGESGDFSDDSTDKVESIVSCDSLAGPSGFIPALRSYSSYEEMQQQPKKFMLCCIKNDSIRAIMLSYLSALVAEMNKGECMGATCCKSNASAASSAGAPVTRPIDVFLDATPEHDPEHLLSRQHRSWQNLTTKCDETRTETTISKPENLIDWGIIEVEDIYDENFLQFLSRVETEKETVERPNNKGSDGDHNTFQPSPRQRPRFDGIVMDLSFYEQLENSYGEEEMKKFPSLQYLRSFIFHAPNDGIPGSEKKRHNQQSSKKSSVTAAITVSQPNHPVSPRLGNTKSSLNSPRAVAEESVTETNRNDRTSNKTARKRKIRFKASHQVRPFLVLLSPLLEKTKIASLFKHDKIDGSLTIPIKKSELRYISSADAAM